MWLCPAQVLLHLSSTDLAALQVHKLMHWDGCMPVDMLYTCTTGLHEWISSYGQVCDLSLAYPRDKPPNAAKSGISLWILVFLNVSSMPSLHLFIRWRAVVGIRSSKISITRRPAHDCTAYHRPVSGAGFLAEAGKLQRVDGQSKWHDTGGNSCLLQKLRLTLFACCW